MTLSRTNFEAMLMLLLNEAYQMPRNPSDPSDYCTILQRTRIKKRGSQTWTHHSTTFLLQERVTLPSSSRPKSPFPLQFSLYTIEGPRDEASRASLTTFNSSFFSCLADHDSDLFPGVTRKCSLFSTLSQLPSTANHENEPLTGKPKKRVDRSED